MLQAHVDADFRIRRRQGLLFDAEEDMPVAGTALGAHGLDPAVYLAVLLDADVADSLEVCGRGLPVWKSIRGTLSVFTTRPGIEPFLVGSYSPVG